MENHSTEANRKSDKKKKMELDWTHIVQSSRSNKENSISFMFECPCIISLYYIKNQQDATLALLFISNCKITLHDSDAFCVHHQEY